MILQDVKPKNGDSSPPPPPPPVKIRSRALSDARGDKVINWIIQNMPEGKQTIVIL